MSEKIVRAFNFLVLLAGCAVLSSASHANPQLFEFPPNIVLKIWMGLLFLFFILSGAYKLCITFNKFYPILSLGSLVVLMILLLFFFAPLFITLPKSGNSDGIMWVIITMVGWTVWDVFMLSINANAVYSSNKDES